MSGVFNVALIELGVRGKIKEIMQDTHKQE
jgi:hypothetical protein